MANPGARRDPFTLFSFSLQIDMLGIRRGQAFFRSVGGLKSESEVIPFQEGGQNGMTHQLVGHAKFPNLILRGGFTGPPFELIRWREETVDGLVKRVNGKIFQLDAAMKPVCGWEFFSGWPCKWEGPDYDASKSELAIETLEIAHEGLRFFGG